jgi:hypothetical protein
LSRKARDQGYVTRRRGRELDERVLQLVEADRIVPREPETIATVSAAVATEDAFDLVERALERGATRLERGLGRSHALL